MYFCEMMTVHKEMGKGFNLQTTWAQRVYTILEIMFEFIFVTGYLCYKTITSQNVIWGTD